MDKKLKEFAVQIYGDLTNYSDTISIARCRIFYKGENRNGGFITDEFAQKLLSSIPYAPVKGIYDYEDGDYVDHGNKNSEGRIYGVVPKDYNLTWEDHLDDDGVTRTYACVDVLLYTELYQEAKEIPDKSQSMELFPPSIKGNWKMINGKSLFVYEDASFFGLQALGDDVEPCFEGAAFYSLRDSFKELINKIDSYSIENNNQEEKEEMVINFKLSDNDKHELLWSSLNPNFTEEGGWIVEYGIVNVYDEYALVVNYETRGLERVYYTKNDSDETVEIGERETAFIVDVNATEKAALEAIHEMNNGTYELAQETFERGQTYNEEKISEFEQKITELENNNSTLTTERDNAQEQFTTANASLEEANNRIGELESEVSELNTFKKGIEDANKDAIISKYAKKLSEEVIDKYTNSKDDYTIESLEKELAFELVNNEPSIFSLDGENGAIVPKETHSQWEFLNNFKPKN